MAIHHAFGFHPRGLAALLIAATAAVCLWSGASWAQEQAPKDPANPFGRKYPPRIYQTVRLEGKPPTIDGKLDDEAWSEGEWAGDYTQQTPTEGAKASERTELKILYDDKHVYFAIHAYDDPAKVHSYPGRRDDIIGDIVGVCFSSYNDKRTGFEFDLTAGGSKIDLILGNGETEWDTTWDAVWDGEVAHDETGWTAEVRVPLSQLRYGPQDEQVWGLHAWRWIDRNQEEDQWQLIPRQNTGRMYNLGELHGIHGLKSPRHLELLPHVVGKAASNAGGVGGTDASATGGVDAKLGVTTNFTLDATVNPDFGQVEADPSVINLTAFETFFEEKRPFFLEGRKIMSFALEDSDQLFYSRRVGQAPSYVPAPGAGETIHSPESTTILGALKLSGKTPGGLSMGLIQSLTQKETAHIASPSGDRRQPVEPFGSYTVARLHKDWGQGHTSLGGMLTSVHRWTSDPALAFLPTQSTTGGMDFTRYFGNRSWVLEASGVFSHVTGDREAITALQTNAVHYYQRPDAHYLGVDENATSLSGYGGSIHVGRSENGRLRLTDYFHAYSPGLELNDLGYLRQADVLVNQAQVGWSEPSPRGIFRTYSLGLWREDHWDFGGLRTNASTGARASAQFANRWTTSTRFGFDQAVDTRALRGGPALRFHDYFDASLSAGSDSSRRVSITAQAEHAWAVDDDSRSTNVLTDLNLRPSNRVSLSGQVSYQTNVDNLQYAATVESGSGTQWILGRIAQDTWAFTLRANLSITPELTVQYYGSPFIGTGRYSAFKKATDTLATSNADRFHLYAPGEIAYEPTTNRYRASEASGTAYAFENPDFSFRQFRSNLVVRWEFKPGSSFYAVWSQGRTDSLPAWESSFSSNWDALWRLRPDNVFLVKISYWFSP